MKDMVIRRESKAYISNALCSNILMSSSWMLRAEDVWRLQQQTLFRVYSSILQNLAYAEKDCQAYAAQFTTPEHSNPEQQQ